MRVVITGAAGVIGSVLRDGLSDRHEIVGIDRRRTGDRSLRRVDMTRAKAAGDATFEGADAIVDLAASPKLETPWSEVWKNNLPATMNALEAARRHGVKRVVYASSNHVVGLYERDAPYAQIVAGEIDGLDPATIPRLDSSSPIRPDSPYAIGKATGEAAARHYSEEFDLRAICLRIGTVLADDTPTRPRHFATLLTHADLVRLFEAALGAPDEVRFGIYYGVSANTWRFWDLEEARDEIGYEPEDDAERLRPRGGV